MTGVSSTPWEGIEIAEKSALDMADVIATHTSAYNTHEVFVFGFNNNDVSGTLAQTSFAEKFFRPVADEASITGYIPGGQGHICLEKNDYTTGIGQSVTTAVIGASKVCQSIKSTSRYSVVNDRTVADLLTSDLDPKYDSIYDVVVVGSGCSGLTSAIVASKHGLKVLVLEKTGYFGGTTAYSGGGAWIPNNKHQRSIDVEDSQSQAEHYLHNVLGELYDEQKVPVYLRSAPEMVEWMEANSDVRFKPVPLPDYHVSKEGASTGRTILTEKFDGRRLGPLIKHVRYPIQGYSAFGSMQADPADLSRLTNPFGTIHNFMFSARKVIRYVVDLVYYSKGTEMANGNALVGRLLSSVQKQGVQLWKNAAATGPVIEHGRVTGLKITKEGEERVIHARKGIVLASGGFGRSEEAKQFVPHEWSVQPRGNTGDGMRIGTESGGALPPKNPMNAIFAPISLLPTSNGPVRGFPHFAIDRSKPGSIIVGPDGRRFANESEPYQEFVTNMHLKKIKKAYYIGDHNHLRTYGMGMALPWPYPIGNLLRKGYLISGPTIASLAEKIGIPPQDLEKTVADYNSFARNGRDLHYGRGDNIYDRFYGDSNITPNPNLRPCERGPFYALPIYPGNVSTMYGLITNIDGQVLDQHGKVIEGLYAVGCDQNSVFKGAYPGGGSSIGPGMTFGYRAGRKIAELDI
ncbi:hypothetical protein EJ03DRAFT_355496 [Teratosphaeria nubilosa]|uniref:FAD-dependent oxidoreductase 2 FAD-binding domain-containing protein n=1 Tax=Teratosphaeria nubilosa TaxID=161662 RepID=A0A6G1KVX2_9PEZI|nr:hypothetical protein EJ03DRAFT_355496 [Teratosphaeria nubilosa]